MRWRCARTMPITRTERSGAGCRACPSMLTFMIYGRRGPRAAGPTEWRGPRGRYIRAGRRPVFAVAGWPAEGWRAPYPRPRVAPTPGLPASAELSFAIETPKDVRMRRSNPENPGRRTLSHQTAGRVRRLPIQDAQAAVLEVRRCA